MSKFLARIFLFLSVAVFAIASGYWYWTTTPLFAFQVIAIAIKQNDLEKFERYVDSQNLVDSALNDLLIRPIDNMPHLSVLGRAVATAAISLPVQTAEKKMLDQIQSFVSGQRIVSQNNSPYRLVSYEPGSNDRRDVLSATQRGISGEISRLKMVAYDRMQEYASGHSDGIVGRLFLIAKNPQPGDFRALLADYGVLPENIRGIAYCNSTNEGNGENCKTGIKFMSPKLHREAVLEIELTKITGNWRLVRFSNIEPLVEELDPSYAIDYASMIQSSVRGMDSKAARVEIDSMAKRITQSDAVQNWLRKFNEKKSN